MFKVSKQAWENARKLSAEQSDTEKVKHDLIFAMCKSARLNFERSQKDCVGKPPTIIS